jgi:WD40 repeat protein
MWVRALCVLRDGRISFATMAKQVCLFDPNTGVETWLNGAGFPLCVLPDGRLACGAEDQTIRLWDLRASIATGRIEGDSMALCLLPDGRLASANLNRIRMWNPVTGTETACIEADSRSKITAMCVLPDGRLATGSWDNVIQLWDTATGREITRLDVEAPVVCITALSAARIVAGDWVGRLHWLEIVD